MNRVYSAAIAVLLLALYTTDAHAQGDVLAELYGQGVHAYFARDFYTAQTRLSEAIDQGSNDPRAYFFRGLSYMCMGRPDEALMDFKIGADLEVNNPDRVYPVADSLQRVQGSVRMTIERERQLARLVARGTQTDSTRSEATRRAEDEVLRKPGRAPTTPPPPSAIPAKPGADPFAEEAQQPPTKAPPRPKPAIAAPPQAEDPFGTPATPAVPAAPAAKPAPAAEDPFGAPAAPAAPAKEADPFGTPAPKSDADTDPFGDDKPAPKPAAAADPFGG